MNEVERYNQIRLAVKGDGDALQRLIVEYHGPLLGVVAGRLGAGLRRYVSAEDVLQQAYVAAFKSIKRCSFDDAGRFYKWLERIALDQLKTVARDLHRAKRDVRRNQSRSPGGKTSIPDLVERVAASQSTPSRHLAKREASAAAISSLARLTDDQRIAIQMRILEGRSAGEIATELGKTEGAVHMLIKRGLDKLAELMGSISRYLGSR